MKNIFLYLVLISLQFEVGSSLLFSQTNEELYEKGLKYRAEYNTKEAFPIFQKLLKSDSNNVNYLSNAAYFYAKAGYMQSIEEEKIKYYKTAEYLALKALKQDEKHADAHYAYALALGRLNENVGSKQKIANSKIIRSEAERAIELDPKLGGAYHVLGRWHRTVAGFNVIEKGMINAFFGGVPTGASNEKAVEYFQKSIVYQPTYILNMYELAATYHEMGKDIEAKVWLKKAMEIPITNDDNKSAREKCDALLKKLE